MLLTPAICTLFAYTTLFRSGPSPGGRLHPMYLEGESVEPGLRTSLGVVLSERGPGRGKHCGQAQDEKGSHDGPPWRSEEHTSELQAHSELVCRLLLEKNKPP